MKQSLTLENSEILSKKIYGESRPCHIDLIRPHLQSTDGTDIYLIDDQYIVHISSEDFPAAAAREAAALKAIRPVLGGAANALPRLIGEGTIEERSFLIVPRFQPMRTTRLWGLFDRVRVRAEALKWVRGLLPLTYPPSPSSTAVFQRCLEALAETEGLEKHIVTAARSAAADLANGQCEPRHIPMHGDLWLGNLLRRSDGTLCIIDWAGSQPQGYGVYDLMRLGISLRVPRRIMKREIAVHSAALGGNEALRLHLLAALGHYAANLGQFPREKFVVMAQDVWQEFSRLL